MVVAAAAAGPPPFEAPVASSTRWLRSFSRMDWAVLAASLMVPCGASARECVCVEGAEGDREDGRGAGGGRPSEERRWSKLSCFKTSLKRSRGSVILYSSIYRAILYQYTCIYKLIFANLFYLAW